jgi:hypothetical protein
MSIIGRQSWSVRSTLAASLLLVVAYVLGAITGHSTGRDFVLSHGQKPFADAAGEHEKATRPPRLEWREPRIGARDDSKEPNCDQVCPLLDLAFANTDWPVERRSITAGQRGPSYVELRTRGPRDPPVALA